MIVISISDCPAKIRGYLTRYVFEISTGVYVGMLSAKVRDLLWQRICENLRHGRAVMVFNMNNEQGFDFKVWNTTWKPVDFDGFKMMLHPAAEDIPQMPPPKSNLPEHFVIYDLETTGLDPQKDRIIEIGAIKAVQGNVEEFHAFINENITIPEKITALTGITEEMLKEGESFNSAVSRFSSFIGGGLVLGYNNSKFDDLFLMAECSRHKCTYPLKRTKDVLKKVRATFPKFFSYRMADVAKQLEIPYSASHRALNDCQLCLSIYRICMKQTETAGVN